MTRALCYLAAACLLACSDDSAPARPDGYPAGDRSGADGAAGDSDTGDGLGDSPAGDWEIPVGAALVVPTGTRMCAMLNVGDVLENHPFAARINFVPGPVALPTGGSFQAAWIGTLEVQPDGAVAAPTSAGTFTHSFDGTTAIGQHIYDFQQTFELDTRTFEVTARATFEVRSGAVVDATKLLDEPMITEDFSLGVGGTMDGRPVAFNTCTYDLFRPMVADIEVDNGDRVELSIQVKNPPCPPGLGCAGGVFWGAITNAAFTSGVGQRSTTNYFRLGWTAYHHEGGQSHLVVFDEPLGSVHGLYMPRHPMGGTADTVHYLGENLETLSSSPITALTYDTP